MLSNHKIKKIIKILNCIYPDVPHFLHHKNVFEFLIAVILSAQTTDNKVNQVTPKLFARFPDHKSLAKADLSEVMDIIKEINYYKTKSKHIIETAKIIEADFGGKVPNNIEDLLKLKGVGRKVANVILCDYFNKPVGIVVDTHVKRVSYRLGFTNEKNPEKIEKDLMNKIPKKYWTKISKQLILIGRNFCHPRKPNCDKCPLSEICTKNLIN
ncbi:MAG: endonuclease III [Candidatus Dojkabacteria bacterium]|nr:endonuclease III [Candidatus Dojkabacteria bacterium]